MPIIRNKNGRRVGDLSHDEKVFYIKVKGAVTMIECGDNGKLKVVND